MKKLSLILAVVVCAAALPAAAQSTSTCFTNGWSHFSSSWRGEGHLIQELHDYGLIFEDAKRSSCAGYAAAALKNKIYTTRINAGTNRLYQGSNPSNTNVPVWYVGPYQNWLESTYVALIFASALQLGGQSQLTSALDSELNWVAYYFDNHPYSLYGKGFNCGINKPGDPYQEYKFGWSGPLSDTCMEEHAIGAAAYAWMSAYNWKRFDAVADIPYYSSTVGYAQKAKTAINNALDVADSICVTDRRPGAPAISGSGRGPCNAGTLADAVAALNYSTNPGSLYSLNRGQNITYGFGQLTALSAAAIGLEEAQQLPTNAYGAQDPTLLFTANQKTIMKHQLWEAQSKAVSTGAYFQGHLGGTPSCVQFIRATGLPDTTLYQCTDNEHRPRWFSLFGGTSTYPTLFSRFLPGTPGLSGAYGFNGFNTQISGGYYQSGDFKLDDPSANGNWGRRVWYGNLGYYWHKITPNRDTYGPQPAPGETRPRLRAIFDDHNPKGYIDAVSATGVVTGWTCDQDMNASNAVDLYAGPKGAGGTFITRAVANAPSETAVNNLCWGSNHRFSVQLPSWAQGQYIYAYGQDYTWGGEYLLPPSMCTAPTCRWN